MELKESKKGDPMVSCWFEILEGKYKKSKLFMNQVITQGFQIHNVNEFLRSLKASFNSSIEYQERFEYIKKVPLLLIDDIGAEKLTDWARDEILGTILQYRMQQQLPTFFTSNLIESLS